MRPGSVAAAAGAEERVFVSLFLEIQKGTLESLLWLLDAFSARK